MHHQRVARLGALDVKRPRQHVIGVDDQLAGLVVPARVEQCGVDGIARLDAGHRLVREGERGVVDVGDDRVRLGDGRGNEQDC